MPKHDTSFYQENARILLLDARGDSAQYIKLLNVKANYKELLSSKMSGDNPGDFLE